MTPVDHLQIVGICPSSPAMEELSDHLIGEFFNDKKMPILALQGIRQIFNPDVYEGGLQHECFLHLHPAVLH